MGTLPALRVDKNANDSPHVVILGAGASVASFPRGDRHGRRLPVMANFVDVVGLRPLFRELGLDPASGNLEEIYDTLAQDPRRKADRERLEAAIFDYFAGMKIPDKVTLYDELLLTLRAKDIIATFNWDPLLVQAYIRNQHLGHLPRIVFLHGNVAIGYCERDRVKGYHNQRCRVCRQPLTRSPLLYPIRDKQYKANPFIAGEWSEIQDHLRYGYILTIIGYGAPASDVNARDLMMEAWGKNGTQELAEIEIVDIRPRRQLVKSWSDFIVRQHYGVMRTARRGLAFHYPRRSCDAFAFATLQNDPWRTRRLPRFRKLTSLHVWLAQLMTDEMMYEQEGRPLKRL
jgi:hypothetical protein